MPNTGRFGAQPRLAEPYHNITMLRRQPSILSLKSVEEVHGMKLLSIQQLAPQITMRTSATGH